MKNESAVQFETDSRIHMGLAVTSLELSVAFYTTLFGQGPTKTQRGYAKFEVAEPKTRVVVDFLERFELSDALFVLPVQDEKFSLSARNIPTVTVLPTEGLNVYDVLRRIDPSPVVALNRAVALGMRDGPAAGLAEVEAVLAQGNLLNYHLAHAARADLLRRLGQTDAAREAYERALSLTPQPAERRFLQVRLAQC